MPVPTHRDDCETRIWKTSCPDCGDPVYFFSCTCGSKVFFDLNRPPWNPHEERCIPYLIRYLSEIEQISPRHIRQLVEKYAREKNVIIPEEIQHRLEALENKGKSGIKIVNVSPADSECIVIGQVVSVNTQVNFLKRFKHSDSVMGRAFLERLIKNSYVEIDIREDPDESTRQCRQYRCFVEMKIFERSRLGLHSRAFAVLNPMNIASQKIWIADTLERE